MEIKDTLILTLGILGWLWGIIQFFVNRRLLRRDKVFEKKYEVYSKFLERLDTLMSTLRDTPAQFINSFFEIMHKANEIDQRGDDVDGKEVQALMQKFNDSSKSWLQNSTQAEQILSNELYNLRLICSEEMLGKIEEIKAIAKEQESRNEMFFKYVEEVMKPDMEDEERTFALQNFQSKINSKPNLPSIEEINDAVIKIMRKEIGYFTKVK